MAITTNYIDVAPVIELHIKEMIKDDLRKRLMEVARQEIDAVIEQVAGDIVGKVSEVRKPDLGGITLQIAINGVRKDLT